MALVVSSCAGPRAPDPTIALKQALAAFESTLTEEQKRQYQAGTTTPDAAGVIAFVAEIDASNNDTTRRCVAARLCTFLEATQQFTSVVDTFVSSNPKIAALVWGGVKMAILAANNVTSYFDKVTNMIMVLGKSCPTYKQFGQLYPGCVRLQQALCDYYAVIVELCIKIIEISRRSAITQTLSSIVYPFESEFKSFLDKLGQAVDDIQLQISLATEQAHEESRKLLEHESKNNAKYRQLALKFHRGSQKEYDEAHQWRLNKMKRDAAKLRTSIRDNLSTANHVKPWKQAIRQRVPSTAEWLQQESAFRAWKDDSYSAILWCSGRMGTGKTILMSNVVAKLHASRQPNDIVSYYFCRADDAASLSARSIIGSLARQMLGSQIEHAGDDGLQCLYEESRDLDTVEVAKFLLSHLEPGKTYYLVLDGLDECDDGEVQKVGRSLARFYNRHVLNLKVICAGRPGLEKLLFKVIEPKYKISVTEQRVESDMDHYITTTLRRCLEEEELKLGDPKLIMKIIDALRDGSSGMFLWTRLCIEELCAQGSDNDILQALKDLPRGLSEIFDWKLGRVQNRTAAKEAMKLLQFCGTVKRPLTLMEYQELLSLTPGQEALDRAKFPNDMHKVNNDCCGMTFVDEEDQTVHFIHHSVKQHLFTANKEHSADFDLGNVDRHVGFLCMTYLDFAESKRQLMKVKEGYRTPINPVQLGTFPVFRSSSVANRFALELLSHRKLRNLSSQELERKAENVLGDIGTRVSESGIHKRGLSFFNYAWTYWIDHLADLDLDVEDSMWRLFCRCVESNGILAYRPWEPEQANVDNRSDMPYMVQWLLAHENYTLLLYHTRHRPHVLTEEVILEILHKVNVHNRYRFTEAMIQQLILSERILRHGLFYASRDGCNKSVASLLRIGADVNARVIKPTARRPHSERVQRLLIAKADAIDHYRFGQPALQAAAGAGHLEIVERLLAAGADVNGRDRSGHTALQEAVRHGHLEIVERFLAAGADVNSTGNTGGTALEEAAFRGSLEIVERLLAAGADVNIPGKYGRTALREAAFGGFLEIVERLLEAGADVDFTDWIGRTALQYAADSGHLEIVEVLIMAGGRRW